MHITRNNLEPTKVKLVVSAGADELSKVKAQVLKKLAHGVKVPGFRAGHVPAAVVEKHVDQNMLQAEVIEETLNRLYAAAVRQEDLRPVTNPEVSIKKFVPFTELEAEMELPVVGAIKLADYKKIKLAKKEVKVEDKDIDEVIESLKQRAAARTEVTRAAKSGDQLTIDFKGTDSKGQPVNGADGNDYPLVLGSNTFIPGFEDNLIGAKPGDTRTFTVTFPKDYGVKALQNKKVTFEVSVKQVAELVAPEVDDNFAAAVGPFKSLDELKADIKKQLEMERQRETDRAFENELLEKIADKSSVELPDVLIDQQIDRIEQEEKQNLAYRGQTWEEHLKEEGVTADEHRDQKRAAAEQRVKASILLTEIAEKEGVQVSEEELQARLELLRQQYRDPAMQTELDKPEVRRDIGGRIMAEKTLEKLTAYAGAK